MHTRDKTGFVVFERLLVEDYELFPPEYRKSRKSALAGTCRCGSKTHGKQCILEGTAGSVSRGMDLPTCSAEQKTGEAHATVVPEERQHPEADGTQEGQETGEAIVPEERQQPEAGGTQEGQETGEVIVPEERQQPEAGGTQEGQETIVPEERQQPEAGGTQEGQETGEANVPEERQHPEAGRKQEKRLELPKKLLANKAVWNIQNKDDMCLYWSIRYATKLRTLQEECRCGRGEDCVWQRI